MLMRLLGASLNIILLTTILWLAAFPVWAQENQQEPPVNPTEDAAQTTSQSEPEVVDDAPQPPAVLSSQDCSKCHLKPVEEIEANGMAHKTEVTCTDCHEGHPPANWDIIPRCSKCHSGTAHFELGVCLTCHTNPHTPLEIELTKDITYPCVTCHDAQIAQLKEHQSFHSSLACTACHNRHGQIPDCSRCHRPHSDAMTEKDCHLCHKAHMPLVVQYGPKTPSESCGACHMEAFELLAASPARHRRLLCVTCHANIHKTVPNCSDCHTAPHPQQILAKFPACGDCHGIAHDLSPTDVRHKKARGRS